jgi:hypothetical protein
MLAAVLTVAVLAATATGVALAADGGGDGPTSSDGLVAANQSGQAGSTESPEAGDEGMGRRLHRHLGGPLGAGIGGPGLLGALHGELVVPKQGGGYQTVLVQRGTVTAVSSTSITVKSQDGFATTYAVTSATVVNAGRDGISSVKKNDSVAVLARRASGATTALRVVDLDRLAGLRDLRRYGHPGERPDRPKVNPSPEKTGTGTAAGVGV